MTNNQCIFSLQLAKKFFLLKKKKKEAAEKIESILPKQPGKEDEEKIS